MTRIWNHSTGSTKLTTSKLMTSKHKQFHPVRYNEQSNGASTPLKPRRRNEVFLRGRRKVFVAMSGGVDSSVAALILKKQGFNVVGVFMKNWTEKVPGLIYCPWEEDQREARQAAAKINIPFYTWDFEKDYKQIVFSDFIQGYQKGETPNPDIICNKEIKFGLFLKKARKLGADFIATGHYVRLKNTPFRQTEKEYFSLFMAKDDNKDQSYFLWTLKQSQLKYCLFPLGGLTKPEVRKIAQKAGLPNALRADSQGLCFVGKVSLKDFLKPYIQEKQGDIILAGFSAKGVKKGGREESVIGKHQGVHLFTFGQRHGIDVGGKEPYFVADKNVKRNILFVAKKKDLPRFFPTQISLRNFSLINSTRVKFPLMCSVRYRYRQSLQKAVVISSDVASRSPDSGCRGRKNYGVQVIFNKPAIGITPGQSIVFYKGKQMLGGGIIKQIPRANCARDKGRL